MRFAESQISCLAGDCSSRPACPTGDCGKTWQVATRTVAAVLKSHTGGQNRRNRNKTLRNRRILATSMSPICGFSSAMFPGPSSHKKFRRATAQTAADCQPLVCAVRTPSVTLRSTRSSGHSNGTGPNGMNLLNDLQGSLVPQMYSRKKLEIFWEFTEPLEYKTARTTFCLVTARDQRRGDLVTTCTPTNASTEG